MSTALLLAGAALLGALALGWRRRERALREELAALRARLDELATRLERSEEELGSALSSSGVAESLLLEKGIADEDEVAAMRRRLVGEPGASQGDGALH